MQLARTRWVLPLVLMVVGQAGVAADYYVPEHTDPPHVADPRFPYKTYPNDHVLNNNTPWQTNVVPFDPNRRYTPAEEDRVIESEANLFQAVAPPRPPPIVGGGDQERQLGINHPPHPDSDTPAELRDTDGVPWLQPEDEQPDEASRFNSGARVIGPRYGNFGSRLFGSRYFTRSELASTAVAGARIETNNYFQASLFNTTQQVARFFVRATCNCPASLPPRMDADIFVIGQQMRNMFWLSSFNIRRPQNVFRAARDFIRARKVFMVGPVPMTITAHVTGNVALDLGAELECHQIGVFATPSSALQVRVEWSVNVIIIQAGFGGRLDLIRVSLPLTLTAGVESWQNPCPAWSARVERDLTTIGGRLYLFSIVRFLFFRQRYELTIANWTGVLLHRRDLVNQHGSFCQFSTPLASL